MRTLVMLGSTGSVGTQALDVVRRNPDRFKVVGLSAGTNQELLVGQIREFLPPFVAIADGDAARDLKERLTGIRGVELLVGPEAAETLAPAAAHRRSSGRRSTTACSLWATTCWCGPRTRCWPRSSWRA